MLEWSLAMLPAGTPFPLPIECKVSKVGSISSVLTISRMNGRTVTFNMSLGFDGTEYEGVRLSVGDKLTVLAVKSPNGESKGCLLDAGISTLLPQAPLVQLLHPIHLSPLPSSRLQLSFSPITRQHLAHSAPHSSC